MAHLRWLTALSALLLLGCDFGVVYVDPPVSYERGGLVIEGDPFVELGYDHEQLYTPLVDGNDAPIVRGLQGGNWTHPTIRTKGIGTPATIDCSVVTDDGEQVGLAKSRQSFFVTADGDLEFQSYPIPIFHTDDNKGPEIDDLYGVGAQLTCRVADDEQRSASASASVVLTEG